MQNLIIITIASFAVGILLAGEWLNSASLPYLYCAATLLACIVIVSIMRCFRMTSWAVGALFIICGMIHFIHISNVPASDISYFAGQSVSVVGKIIDNPQTSPVGNDQINVRYKLNALKVITEKGEQVPVTGGVLISSRQRTNMAIAVCGTQVMASGKLSLPHGYGNPGLIDSAAALRRDGITARLSVLNGQIFFDSGNDSHWRNILYGWRENIAGRIEKAISLDKAAILIGILFGGYSGIPREVVESFTATGLVHILSVSGTHIALVAGVVMWLSALVQIRLRLSIFFAVAAIILYALISGCTPPVIRSAIVGIIGLAAVGLGREKDAPTALMLAAFAMVIYQPETVYDISFQLSFGAAAGLIFLYGKTLKTVDFLPRWLASPIAVTLAAQLGVLPFIAWYFTGFSLSSFIANIVVVPFIEAAVAIGLFAAVIGAVFAPANLLWVLCGSLIGAAVSITQQLAAIPGSYAYIPPIGLEAGILYYCILAWAYGYKPKAVPTPAAVIKRWPRYSLIFGFGCIAAFIIYINSPGSLYVHFIDVGQGDATLIVTPHHRAVLIDTGGSLGDINDFDVGERVVLPYLKHYGILNIDYLILTHGHQDHAGGAAAIASHLPVKNILLTRETFTAALEKLITKADNSRFIPVYKNQKIFLDGLSLTIVHDAVNSRPQAVNESSSVIRADFGSYSFLITGDLEANGEKDMLKDGANLSSTVLKVGHHGSRTSTTADFLAAVKPSYAVISVGYNNRFGHPHSEVLSRLSGAGSQIYRTDQHGAIVFQTDGERLFVSTFR